MSPVTRWGHSRSHALRGNARPAAPRRNAAGTQSVGTRRRGIWAFWKACIGGLVAMNVAHSPALGQSMRPRVDLNGTWQFRMDPKNEGADQKWSLPGADYPDRIHVPGNWQAQGFGPAHGWLRHDYQGKAWYRRTVQVPADWAGKRIWLHLGGTSNTAEVCVNGVRAGTVDGFIAPYEFDVTPHVRPGAENVVACCVDSASPAPVGMFNFIGRWGGLYRGAFLEARSDPAIDDLFVIPDVKNKTARVQVTLRRQDTARAWQGALRVHIAPSSGDGSVDGQSTVTMAAGRQESDPAVVAVQIPDMRPWSPEDPFLYRVEVVLAREGNPVDSVRDRFGMRQFEVGKQAELLLNGRPYFVRGLGDDTFEILTGTQKPDKEVYRARLSQIKRYGFNGVRFLSHVPIQEYFEAADEVGVLVMCEGVVYHKPKPMIPLLKSQVARIARAYRNRPSWYIWSSGNELFECQGVSPDREWMDYVRFAHDTFKRLDPTRFFVASDGADVFPTDIITQRAKFDSQNSPPSDHPFDGLIDEVAYFKRALSDADMAKAADRSAGAPYAAAIRALQPSGYWRLDETALGEAKDSSGHDHHGRHDATMKAENLNQPGALDPQGSGGAIRTGAMAKGVSLRKVAADTFAVGNAPFSLSLWAKPHAFRVNDWGNSFSFGAASTGCALLVALDGQNASGRIVLGSYWGNFLTSEAPLAAGQWNHVGIAYDGTVLKLFLNGKPDKSVRIQLGIVPVDGHIGNVVTLPIKDDRYDKLPHIWHEFPNTYIGPLPDLTVDRKFTGVFRDDNYLSHHRREIADLNLTEKYPAVYQRSVDHYYLYLKQMFEAARSSPTMDGFGLWLMTDTPAGPEGDANFLGIFNLLYEPAKFPDPAAFLPFNRETVLLLDAGPEQRVLAAGEPKKVTLSISHYGIRPIENGKLFWEVREQGQILQRGVQESIQVRPGEVKPLGVATLGPCEAASGRTVRLHARLESPTCRQENQWDLWVMPRSRRDLLGKPLVNLTGVKEIDQRYAISAAPASPLPRVVLANRLTPEVEGHLTQGRTVLLLAEEGTLARARRFTFWAPWIRSTGTYIEDHPAVAGFPHRGFCSYQFYRLFGDAVEALDITDRGSLEREKLAPVVWGMSGDYDPALKSDWSEPRNRWKLYRVGMICEGRVGNGRLVVCSFRVLDGLRHRLPEAGHLLDCLVEYALSDRMPPAVPAMTPEEARRVFAARSAGPK